MVSLTKKVLQNLAKVQSFVPLGYAPTTGVGKCPNVSHHPTIEDISSPTDIYFGDVKPNPQKLGHQSQPLFDSL